jgi:hypothetical protein
MYILEITDYGREKCTMYNYFFNSIEEVKQHMIDHANNWMSGRRKDMDVEECLLFLEDEMDYCDELITKAVKGPLCLADIDHIKINENMWLPSPYTVWCENVSIGLTLWFSEYTPGDSIQTTVSW